MRVLGVDPGSVKIGYAVIEDDTRSQEHRPVLLDFGLWSPATSSKKLNEKSIESIEWLYKDLLGKPLIHESKTAICLERVPTQRMGQRDRVLAVENFFRSYAVIYRGHTKSFLQQPLRSW